MFPKIIKLILAIAFFLYGGYEFYESYIGNGIFLSLLSGMMVLLYFKNEMIFLAFLRLRKQDFQGLSDGLIRLKTLKALW